MMTEWLTDQFDRPDRVRMRCFLPRFRFRVLHFFIHLFSEEQLFMVFKHAMAILKVD